MYVLNIVFQAFFTLLMPAGLGFLISWLLVRYASLPNWVYAPFLIVGLLIGLYSMVKFVIVAMSGYERLEREQAKIRKAKAEQVHSTRAQAKGSGERVRQTQKNEENKTKGEKFHP